MTKALNPNPAAFTDPVDEDTIELELSPEQLLLLSRACADSEPAPRPTVPPAARAKTPRAARVAVVLGVASALVLVGGYAYIGTQSRPVHTAADTGPVSDPVPEAPATPAPLSAANAPVRFTNPFDATEVFEFPPGTSEIEARNAVAEFLLQRARDRRYPSPSTRREARQPGEEVAPPKVTRLAQRG